MLHPRFLTEAEEHSFQFATKTKARTVAKIESQRTGVAHTHYLITTWRNMEPRFCWAIIPTRTAEQRLREA
jgi:hypothetical protein